MAAEPLRSDYDKLTRTLWPGILRVWGLDDPSHQPDKGLHGLFNLPNAPMTKKQRKAAKKQLKREERALRKWEKKARRRYGR